MCVLGNFKVLIPGKKESDMFRGDGRSVISLAFPLWSPFDCLNIHIKLRFNEMYL